MKVLYIGVFDETGWGVAAQNYILALDSAGVDVVARPVILSRPMSLISERMKVLIDKDCSKPDVAIQHVLPHMMDYDGRLHNIGLYATETMNYGDTNWVESLNGMDELWIPNNQMERSQLISGVDRKSTVIHHASDMKRFERKYNLNPYIKRLKDDGNFIFYTIGEFNRRKNFAALLKAFYMEFDPTEPVELVLKTSGVTKQFVEDFSKGIQAGTKLYANPKAYKNIHIITDHLTDEQLCSIHVTSDCFVQPSNGEAWSYPAFDAMAFGKTPIVTDCGGYLEYINSTYCKRDQIGGWLVEAREEPCFNYLDTFQEHCSSNDVWAAADLNSLRDCMRQAYEAESIRKAKSEAGISRAYDFSHEKIGNRMKEVLLCQNQKSIGKT